MDRTAPRSASRAIRIALVVMLALALLSAGGCDWFGPAKPEVPPRDDGPSTVVTETPAIDDSSPTTAPVTATRSLGLKAYFVYQEKVQPVYRAVPHTPGVVKAAVTALLASPTSAEKAKGITSEVPAGTKLLGVNMKDGVAYVDLSSAFDDGGGTMSMGMRLAQLTYTATQFPGVKGVVLKMNGKVVDVFSGEGIELNGRVQKRSDYENETPAILIDMPAWGATERDPASLKGTANVFEARFGIQIIGPNGKVLVTKYVSATSGTGTRGTWTASIPYTIAKSGWGKVKVFDNAETDDGAEQNVVVIPVYLVK